jgi:hypothetical protein
MSLVRIRIMATVTFTTTPGAFTRRFLLSAAAPVSTGAAAVQPLRTARIGPSPVAHSPGIAAPA